MAVLRQNSVQKYRKKPVVIDALLVEQGYRNLDDITDFIGIDNLCPIERRPDYTLKIRTLEGDMAVTPGDYIIKGVAGEFYPCKPDIFRETYDLLPERRQYRCWYKATPCCYEVGVHENCVIRP